MTPRSSPELTFPDLHRQQVTVAFDAPDIVSDTGLLTLRDLDQRLGYLADLARRLPDPRAPPFITHSKEPMLTQQVYQILADYPDGKDADQRRHDPLFQTLAGRGAAVGDPRGTHFRGTPIVGCCTWWRTGSWCCSARRPRRWRKWVARRWERYVNGWGKWERC